MIKVNAGQALKAGVVAFCVVLCRMLKIASHCYPHLPNACIKFIGEKCTQRLRPQFTKIDIEHQSDSVRLVLKELGTFVPSPAARATASFAKTLLRSPGLLGHLHGPNEPSATNF